jgi:hypothetical protein
MTDISSRNSTKNLDCYRIRTLTFLITSRDRDIDYIKGRDHLTMIILTILIMNIQINMKKS